MKLLILLSGPVAVGKSSIAKELIASHKFQRISTGAYLNKMAQEKGINGSRTGLQQLGDALDEQTDYRWVVDEVAVVTIANEPVIDNWLLDSVRKERQVWHFRSQYGARAFHVHLDAPEALLMERYNARIASGSEYSGNVPYGVAIQHPNEVSSRKLIEVADVVINVSGKSPSDIAKEVLSRSPGWKI